MHSTVVRTPYVPPWSKKPSALGFQQVTIDSLFHNAFSIRSNEDIQLADYFESALKIAMDWVCTLAYITRTLDQELLLRNEYLVAENWILKTQLNTRL